MINKVILLILVFQIIISGRAYAQCNENPGTLIFPPYNNLNVNFSTTEANNAIQNKQSDKSGVSGTAIISGSIMVAGGAVLCAGGYYLGRIYYDRYRKSAFTENTDMYRKRVTGCKILGIGGAVIGGTGVLVFSFAF